MVKLLSIYASIEQTATFIIRVVVIIIISNERARRLHLACLLLYVVLPFSFLLSSFRCFASLLG